MRRSTLCSAQQVSPTRPVSGFFLFFALLFGTSMLQAQTTWTGSASTNWANAANWTAGVPDATDDVTIPNVTLPNVAPVILGGTVALAKSVSVNTSASLTIHTMSSLTINGSSIHAGVSSSLYNQGTIMNSGSITIGNLVIGGFSGILNLAVFNNTGGEINIDRSISRGITNDAGTFTNGGKIIIGAMVSNGQAGIWNNATFYNNAGEINIDRSTSYGISNEQNAVFSNTAKIVIGAAVASGSQVGIGNRSTFDNNASGQISIDRTNLRGLANVSGAFTNAGKITIGGIASVGTFGITNEGTTLFNNNASGEIHIDRSTTTGLWHFDGTFNNAGKIIIGAAGSVGSYGLRNKTVFNNSPCAALINIVSNNIIENTGTFTNAGSIIENAGGNSSITTNTGVVQNLNSGNFTIGSGNPAITNPAPQNPCFTCPATGAIWYVNAAAASGGNGASWDCAFQDLQLALAAASSGQQIWVAKGTYKPTGGADRTISFIMKNGVEILGGFPNTGQPGLGDRDWVVNMTTLSGDIGAAGTADNTYHVVFFDHAPNSTLLDGFTITGGNGEMTQNGGGIYNDGSGVGRQSNPRIANCTITGNVARNGAGLFNDGYRGNSSPNVTNCVFSGNKATRDGGAVYNFGGNNGNSSPVFSNGIFSGNKAERIGGGVFNDAVDAVGGVCNPSFINGSFSGNQADFGVGGMYNDAFTGTCSPMITNCIFWGNAMQIDNRNATPAVAYSIVQGGYAGTGNLDFDPLFVAQPPIGLGTTGDLHLQICSPAIDAGNDGSAPATDLGQNTRFDALVGGSISDIGAFEFQSAATPTVAICQSAVTAILDNTGQATVLATALNNGSTGCSPLGLSIGGQPSISFNCSQKGNQIVTLTATYRNRTATCAATVAVVDNIPPTVVCKPFTTNLSAAGTAGITPANVFQSGADNCGTVNLASVVPNTFGFNNLGPNNVLLTINDGNGNTASCAATVQVSANADGKIIWKQDNNTGVKDVVVALTGDQTASVTTPLSGLYGFTLTSGNNFTITPTKNINKLNGVNAQDVFRFQQHLMGNLVTDPWQLIAMDANSDNTVNSLDLSIIQQSIMGNPQAQAQMVKSWRFVPTSHTLTNPPWSFPERIILTGASGNQVNKDFYGVKVGDIVALYANPANLNAEPPFVLTAPDKFLQAGDDITIDFRANEIADLAAFQFGLHFDTQRLELQEIQSLTALPLTNDNFGLYEKAEGNINVLWAGTQATDVPEAAPVFRLTFKVLTNGGKLSDALQLNEDALLPRAYKTNLAESTVLLHFFGVSGTNNPGALQDRFVLYQNQPNPFATHTSIDFELPQACAAQLRIFDATGRVIALRNNQYNAGLHREVFDLEGVSGVLYYELSTPFGVLSRKMLVVIK